MQQRKSQITPLNNNKLLWLNINAIFNTKPRKPLNSGVNHNMHHLKHFKEDICKNFVEEASLSIANFKVKKNRVKFEKMSEDSLEHKAFEVKFPETLKLAGNEIAYLLIITVLLVFLTAWIRVSLDVDTSSSKYPIIIEHYGFPFDTMKKNYTYTPGVIVFRGNVQPTGFVKSTTEFVPSGIVLNFLIYGVISFVIVKLSSKIMDKLNYYKHID